MDCTPVRPPSPRHPQKTQASGTQGPFPCVAAGSHTPPPRRRPPRQDGMTHHDAPDARAHIHIHPTPHQCTPPLPNETAPPRAATAAQSPPALLGAPGGAARAHRSPTSPYPVLVSACCSSPTPLKRTHPPPWFSVPALLPAARHSALPVPFFLPTHWRRVLRYDAAAFSVPRHVALFPLPPDPQHAPPCACIPLPLSQHACLPSVCHLTTPSMRSGPVPLDHRARTSEPATAAHPLPPLPFCMDTPPPSLCPSLHPSFC